MEALFFKCLSLLNIYLSKLNTEIVSEMTSMFSYCTGLSDINLTNLNIQKLDLSNINTQNVTHMSYMFSGWCFIRY